MRGRGLRKPVAAAAILAGLALAWAVLDACSRPSRPSVIVISIDTLRPDRMGVHGHRPLGRSTTPNLDELAAGGAVFTDAVSTTSWTLPAHWSLLTGLSDELHDMVDDRVPPPADVPVLPELLRRGGYATGGFYSGPYLHPFFGFGRGFDVYESCMEFDTIYDVAESELKGLEPGEIAGRTALTEKRSHEARTSEAVTDAGIRFVEGNAGTKPFFLFLHYFDVHNDYIPPAPFDTRFGPPYSGWVDGRGVTTDPRINPDMAPEDLARLKALYDGEIGFVDEHIGRLFRALDRIRPGMLDETLVVVTSDHGEEFFEHGAIGHRKSLYEESVRVPLIVRWPGRVPEGVRTAAAARIYDVMPTILDLIGLPAPRLRSGRSLHGAMKGEDTGQAPAILELTRIPRGGGGTYTKLIGLRLGSLKLVTRQEREWSADNPVDFTGALVSEGHELFDLAEDPAETRNLYPERDDLFRKMMDARGLLFDEMRRTYLELRDREAADPRELPEEVKQRLRRAGYLH